MKPVVKKATPAAIAVLRQATALKPKRNKASDGLLPSLAHQKQNPSSDHNTGFAVDLTHDPVFGFDGHELYEKLKADVRVKYLIFWGKIWSLEKGDHNYTGVNQHKHHIHISIKETMGDDTSNWFPWLPEPKVVDKVKAKVKPLPKKKVAK
jgi:hypothetical protein